MTKESASFPTAGRTGPAVVRHRGGGLPVLDLPGDAAPDVVPVELLLVGDIGGVIVLGVIGGDGDAFAIELTVLLRLLARIEGAGLGVEADREAHAALPI